MDKTQSASHLRAKDLGAGDEVRMLFLVSAASQQQARNGPFWRLELKDASASLEARIWNPLSQHYADIPVGGIAEVEGRAESFRDRIQINVTRLRVLTQDELGSVDISTFLPASSRSPQVMFDELEALCRAELTHEPWCAFALGVLDDPDIRPRLLIAPAAKSVHHAWVGGLLEHTLSVATLCLRFCDQYPDLDRQTLLVGALCHDLGKLWELTGGLANDYTDEGRLIGHINLCLGKLEPHLIASGLSPDLALHLRHLVLSHHGQYEFGSPRLPQTAEAFALHYADNLDAKMTQSRSLFVDLEDGETGWSPYQKTLERALYQAPRTPTLFSASPLTLTTSTDSTLKTPSATDATGTGTTSKKSQAHAVQSEQVHTAPVPRSQRGTGGKPVKQAQSVEPVEQTAPEESDPRPDVPPPWDMPDSEPPPWEPSSSELPPWEPSESAPPPWELPDSDLPLWDMPEPQLQANNPLPSKLESRARRKTVLKPVSKADPKPELKPESKPESKLEPRINQCSLL